MNAEELIRELKIASPCHARWDDMEGNDQSRFCRQCSKNVYNFTNMSAEAAKQLVLEHEGRLCGRFYRRSDGTLLTADCPVGLHRRIRKVAYAAVLFLFAGMGAFAFGSSSARAAYTRTTRSGFYRSWDDLVWQVKGWFGVRRPMIAGGICAPPVRPPPPPVANQTSN